MSVRALETSQMFGNKGEFPLFLFLIYVSILMRTFVVRVCPGNVDPFGVLGAKRLPFSKKPKVLSNRLIFLLSID